LFLVRDWRIWLKMHSSTFSMYKSTIAPKAIKKAQVKHNGNHFVDQSYKTYTHQIMDYARNAMQRVINRH
jgi:hypothetical protein